MAEKHTPRKTDWWGKPLMGALLTTYYVQQSLINFIETNKYFFFRFIWSIRLALLQQMIGFNQ